MNTSVLFYNVFAKTYKRYCENSNISLDDMASIDVLISCKPKSVLEFGVGTGRFATAVLAHAPHVIYTGVDNSKEMLARCTNQKIITHLIDIDLFLDECIKNETYYDCIIAPYTELHHIPVVKQISLIEKMKQVSSHIFLNCLTKEEEFTLFNKNTSLEIKLDLNNKNLSTVIYPIEKTIRANAITIKLPSGVREFLYYIPNPGK